MPLDYAYNYNSTADKNKLAGGPPQGSLQRRRFSFILLVMATKENKERFRAGATLDEKTVTCAYRTALYTYGKPGIIIRSGLGAVILLTVLFVHMPVWSSLIAMILGCWLFVSYDFPARAKARSYFRKNAGKKETRSYRFTDDFMLLKEGERRYTDIDRLVYDDEYLHIFFSRKDYMTIEIASVVPHNTQRLKALIASKSGKEWGTTSMALMSHSERREKRKRNKSL